MKSWKAQLSKAPGMQCAQAQLNTSQWYLHTHPPQKQLSTCQLRSVTAQAERSAAVDVACTREQSHSSWAAGILQSEGESNPQQTREEKHIKADEQEGLQWGVCWEWYSVRKEIRKDGGAWDWGLVVRTECWTQVFGASFRHLHNAIPESSAVSPRGSVSDPELCYHHQELARSKSTVVLEGTVISLRALGAAALLWWAGPAGRPAVYHSSWSRKSMSMYEKPGRAVKQRSCLALEPGQMNQYSAWDNEPW